MAKKHFPKKNLEFFLFFQKKKRGIVIDIFLFHFHFFYLGKISKKKKLADYHTFIVMTFLFYFFEHEFFIKL